MPYVGFGSAAVLSGWSSSAQLWSDGIGLPAGRAMANGEVLALLSAIQIYAGSHNGATHPISLDLAGIGTAAFNVSPVSAAYDTGYHACSGWTNGGTGRITINTYSAGTYFARGGGGTVGSTAGGTFAGTLGGAYFYTLCALAPTFSLALTATYGQIAVNISAPADFGDSAITGYRIEYWDAANPGTIYTSDVAGSSILAGLGAGSWVVRVSTRNAVSAARSTSGPYSSTQSLAVPSTGKVSADGVTFTRANVRAWNGTAWVQAFVRVWDGATFVPAL